MPRKCNKDHKDDCYFRKKPPIIKLYKVNILEEMKNMVQQQLTSAELKLGCHIHCTHSSATFKIQL